MSKHLDVTAKLEGATTLVLARCRNCDGRGLAGPYGVMSKFDCLACEGEGNVYKLMEIDTGKVLRVMKKSEAEAHERSGA